MRGYDYPIEYFDLMSRVALYLGSIEAQLLSSEYSYETFGSWWFAFMKKGNRYRVVYDGRDFELRFEKDPVQGKVHGVYITQWKEVLVLQVGDQNGPHLQKSTEQLIQQGLAKEGLT